MILCVWTASGEHVALMQFRCIQTEREQKLRCLLFNSLSSAHYILLLLTFHISFLNNIHHHYELSNCCYYFVKKCAWPFIINSLFFFFLCAYFCILLLSNCCCFCFALFHFSQATATTVDCNHFIWKTHSQPNCLAKRQAREKKCDEVSRGREREQKRRLHPLFIQY